MKPRLLFAVADRHFHTIFADSDLNRIRAAADVVAAPVPDVADQAFLMRYLPEAQVVVSSWGTARLDAAVIAAAPHLQLLCHGAGTVKPYVSDALWEHGVRVTSASAAIAPGVAEYTLGLILAASKRIPWLSEGIRAGGWRDSLDRFGGPTEIYRQKIGVIGAGYVGRLVIGLLQHFSCTVLLYDPYCSADEARRLGVEKVDSLDMIFRECDVVSLHAPVTDETRGMLRGHHFALLREGALFINSARGVLINEPEFIAELSKGRFVACLDVTDPVEPPPADHPFRRLPNVLLTPHIAGAVAQNLLRIGAMVAEEVEAFSGGQPPHYEVRREQLDRIA
ncbi:MAG: hydroxyacid dehydrogenase [Chloroflexi bacterium]|nr:hydroxyacid dehydrogenase [Chloroflexota bacterium]